MTPTTNDRTAPDTPDASEEQPAPDAERHACGYCGRAFAREDWLALHRGLDHADRLTDDERAAYEAALEREEEALRLFRLKAVGVLVLVYFGFIMVYSFVVVG
jgi:hypothetical protein